MDFILGYVVLGYFIIFDDFITQLSVTNYILGSSMYQTVVSWSNFINFLFLVSEQVYFDDFQMTDHFYPLYLIADEFE